MTVQQYDAAKAAIDTAGASLRAGLVNGASGSALCTLLQAFKDALLQSLSQTNDDLAANNCGQYQPPENP